MKLLIDNLINRYRSVINMLVVSLKRKHGDPFFFFFIFFPLQILRRESNRNILWFAERQVQLVSRMFRKADFEGKDKGNLVSRKFH